MTPPTLDELMKLAKSASPGPWTLVGRGEYSEISGPEVVDYDGILHPRDSHFIAAANPDTVLKILRDYKRMREALEKIKYGGVDSGVSANTFERILVMCETSTDCLAALEFVKGSA